MTYGVSFSRKACSQFNLKPEEVLRYAINTLGIRHFRCMSYWDDIEIKPGIYDFSWLDEDLQLLSENNCTITLAVGLRQPRWPECHPPRWVKDLADIDFKEALYIFNETVINRYKSFESITSWQLENEALNHGIGTCTNFDRARLAEEYSRIKQIDPSRSILMSTSNSWGLPIRSPRPDIVGFSLYLSQHTSNGYSFSHPSALLHKLRKVAVKKILRRQVIIHELQAEPWGPVGTEKLSDQEQMKSMSPEILQKSLRYAQNTGITHADLWGLEWWTWRMKEFNDRRFEKILQKVFS